MFEHLEMCQWAYNENITFLKNWDDPITPICNAYFEKKERFYEEWWHYFESRTFRIFDNHSWRILDFSHCYCMKIRENFFVGVRKLLMILMFPVPKISMKVKKPTCHAMGYDYLEFWRFIPNLQEKIHFRTKVPISVNKRHWAF